MVSPSLKASTRFQSVSLFIGFILFTLLLGCGPEGDHPNIVSALGVNQRQQPSPNHGYGNIHQTAFVCAAGIVGTLVRVVVDKMGIPEVEAVLFQVGLPLCLVPDKHNLIVATINEK